MVSETFLTFSHFTTLSDLLWSVTRPLTAVKLPEILPITYNKLFVMYLQ